MPRYVQVGGDLYEQRVCPACDGTGEAPLVQTLGTVAAAMLTFGLAYRPRSWCLRCDGEGYILRAVR